MSESHCWYLFDKGVKSWDPTIWFTLWLLQIPTSSILRRVTHQDKHLSHWQRCLLVLNAYLCSELRTAWLFLSFLQWCPWWLPFGAASTVLHATVQQSTRGAAARPDAPSSWRSGSKSRAPWRHGGTYHCWSPWRHKRRPERRETTGFECHVSSDQSSIQFILVCLGNRS